MSNPLIEIMHSHQVARVVLNRPEVHNAFNDELIAAIAEAFKNLKKDPEVRVVILESRGKSFCSGGDLNWMKKMADYTREENLEDAKKLAEMFQAVRDFPTPVIARVHGPAYAGGVGLIAACDFAVSLRSATFAITEVKVGLAAASIAVYLLDKMKFGDLLRYILTAEIFTAEKGKEIGLIQEVVETEEEMDKWIEKICDSIRKNSPQAVAKSKELFRYLKQKDLEETQKLTIEAIADIRVSPEGQEGLKAFLEKRKPGWQI